MVGGVDRAEAGRRKAGELWEWVLVEGAGRAELRRKVCPTDSVSTSFPELQIPGTSTASFQHWGSRKLLG